MSNTISFWYNIFVCLFVWLKLIKLYYIEIDVDQLVNRCFKDKRDWEADLDHLESLIDEKSAAIIVNNPSNPCGSVYSRNHLNELIRIAEKHKLPIIADEVYGNMVFRGKDFYYMSELTQRVPILSCNSLSKRFLLPGWRFGWIALHDPKDYLKSKAYFILFYFFVNFSMFQIKKRTKLKCHLIYIKRLEQASTI